MNFVNIDSDNINHFKSKEFASVMEFLNDGKTSTIALYVVTKS